MSYSIIEGCIRQSSDLPIQKDMKDEILVEEKKLRNRKNPLYVVTSVHAEAINNMTRKKSLDEVDLQSLKDLGFAVAHNKLDKDGNKCYIKHNARTFKEHMDKKKVEV
jgi:hypothetical protein|tara:strand:- start:19 stop:342 length:324 start_codon:yes stop_codon:yes gene_type:complete